MDKSARNDAIAGLLVFAVVAVFGPATSEIFIDPRDPGFGAQDFPIMVLVSMTVLALALVAGPIAQLVRSRGKFQDLGDAGPIFRYLVPMVVLGFVYVSLLELFQYLLPTFVALAGSLAIFGNRGAARLVVIPALVAIIFYVLFYGVFGLNEPAGSILSYDNAAYFRPFRAFLGLQ